MSHTPGPWEIGFYRQQTVVYDSRGNGTVAIATVHDIAAAGKQANANLIAAAPDLLEACEAMLAEFCVWEDHQRTHPDADRARAAIKKARGEA